MPIAILVGTLVFGYVSAPEPPDTRASTEDAVLRVFSPEGEAYRILWNYETLEIGATESGSDYRDYELPPEAGSLEEGFNLALDKVENETGERWDGPLKAVLFVEGEYAACTATGFPVIRLYWRPVQDPGNPLTRAMCGAYRYDRAPPTRFSPQGLQSTAPESHVLPRISFFDPSVHVEDVAGALRGA